MTEEATQMIGMGIRMAGGLLVAVYKTAARLALSRSESSHIPIPLLLRPVLSPGQRTPQL